MPKVLIGRMLESGGAVLAHYYYYNTDDEAPKHPASALVVPPKQKKMRYILRYEDYSARYDAASKTEGTMPPRLSPSEHALAVRVLTRLSEAHRYPERIRELRNRLLLAELPQTGD